MTDDRTTPILLRRLGSPGRGGPRVLLLHGMAGSAALWAEFAAGSASAPALHEAELWAAELPWRGGGRAEWHHRVHAVDQLAQALELAVAEAGRIDVVVAHSYSATALLHLMCRTDGAHTGVAGMVLIAPFYRAAPGDFDWADVAGLSEMFVRAMEEGIRAVAAGRGNPDLFRPMAEHVCRELGPYSYARFLEAYLGTPFLPVGGLATPALVLSGAADSVAAPAESAALAAALPGATRHEIAGCGHYPMLEHPRLIVELVDQFCTTTSALELNR